MKGMEKKENEGRKRRWHHKKRPVMYGKGKRSLLIRMLLSNGVVFRKYLYLLGDDKKDGYLLARTMKKLEEEGNGSCHKCHSSSISADHLQDIIPDIFLLYFSVVL